MENNIENLEKMKKEIAENNKKLGLVSLKGDGIELVLKDR